MDYRPEIDGLRAIAVLSVVLFHGGFSLFQGGFVGVDMFFVISGYLITGVILEDLKNDRFSFGFFCERRVRRILPAFVFVLIACLPFAWLWMLPKQLQTFFESFGTAALGLSNFYFMSQVDYFAPSTELNH